MDLEMTGLDIEVESIIEIATVITDADLNIIATGPNLAIKVNQELIDGMDEWNTKHHTASGLVKRVQESLINEVEAANGVASCYAVVKQIDEGIEYGWDHHLTYWTNVGNAILGVKIAETESGLRLR